MASGILVDDASSPVGLRSSQESDRAFLHAVYESTRWTEFANAGWGTDEIRTLLVSQFATQDTYYRRQYSRARFDIIMRGASPVGRLYHDWSGSHVCVVDIALLPQYRGAGIGTRIMRALVTEAAQRAKPMRLHVEFDNPVRSLYRRLGFVQVGENGVYEQMQRDAVPFDGGETVPLAGLIASAA